MSTTITHKSFAIKPGHLVAKEWNGVDDNNADDQLTFAGDAVKNFEVTPEKIVYYNADGSPSVTIDVDGTTLH